MIAALTRVFGVHNLALAEDVVQDAFCKALEVWKVRGLPDNPSAWLMTTAKNRALDVIRRDRTARTYAPEMGRLLESEWTIAPVVEEAFAAHTIRDEQLRMMFSCCHPRLAEEAQVALVLNILCGFGAERDCRRVPRRPCRGREANRARQEGSRRRQAAVRPVGRRVRPASLGREARLVPALQRGLPRRLGRIGCPHRPVHRGDAPDLAAARVSSGRLAGDDSACVAHVAARGEAAGARRCRRRSESSPRAGSIAMGRATRRRRARAPGALGGRARR